MFAPSLAGDMQPVECGLPGQTPHPHGPSVTRETFRKSIVQVVRATLQSLSSYFRPPTMPSVSNWLNRSEIDYFFSSNP